MNSSSPKMLASILLITLLVIVAVINLIVIDSRTSKLLNPVVSEAEKVITIAMAQY